MLSDFQKDMASVQLADLMDVKNKLNYNDGLISGVQAVRVAFKETKMDENDILVTADVAFRFSGRFKGNDFVFKSFGVIQTDINMFGEYRVVRSFSSAEYPVNDEQVLEAKKTISDFIKENLLELFYYHNSHSEKKIITERSTKLADGVVLKGFNPNNAKTFGGYFSAEFVVNGKDINVEYELILKNLATNPVFSKDLELVKDSENLVHLREFRTGFLTTAPITPDPDFNPSYEYEFKPNDPNFTYEQKLSIANYLIYDGLQKAKESNFGRVIGVFGEDN